MKTSIPAKSAVLALMLGSLSACSVLPRAETATVYRLPDAAALPAAAPRQPSLQVATPQAAASLNRTAITVLPSPEQVNNYRGARWSDPAPVLFRDAVARRLRQASPDTLISTDDSSLPTELTLDGHLDAFQTEYRQGQPWIVIRYDAQLLPRHASDAVAVCQFNVELAPAGPAVPQIVAGFGSAMDQLNHELIGWVDSPPASRVCPNPSKARE